MAKTKHHYTAIMPSSNYMVMLSRDMEDYGFCDSSIESAYRNTERNGGYYE